MREWLLGKSDPYQLIIAADTQITPPDYCNDQIWELNLDGGEPPAIALQTSFGLRARSLRLFPKFQRQDLALSDPSLFVHPAFVIKQFPNFITVKFSPFDGIEVTHEIWAATSQVLTGRFTFFNTDVKHNDFNFEWAGVLNYRGSEGRSLSATPMGINNVLEGATEDLQVVCFMTGGPSPNSGPFPSLALNVSLPPGSSRQITWALAALGNSEESYDLARQTTGRDWEAEVTRIEMLNASRQVEIFTGNQDWDAALATSQKIASSLIYSPGENFPKPSFVLARTPEQGYSLRGNGSDYTHLWNGQTALDTWYITSNLLPGMEEIASGFIDNFLSIQQSDGFIDWKPGIAGQRSKRLAQPLLATIAWRIFEAQGDLAWLEKAYPGLLAFVKFWFEPQHDSDKDGYPEWDHPYQIGLDSIPLFHPWQKGAQGVDPGAIESPALAAFLYRECMALSFIAALTNIKNEKEWLDNKIAILRTHIESQWDPEEYTYTYRDAVTHENPDKVELASFKRSGSRTMDIELAPAQRLVLQIKTADEKTRQTSFSIHGKNQQGEFIEEVTARQIRWLHGEGRYTTVHHFMQVDEITVTNLQDGDSCSICTIDFKTRDISLLLPLWAGIPEPEQAKKMIEKTILHDYLQPFGLQVCPVSSTQKPEDPDTSVNLLWNQLIVEGMLRYGFRTEAAKVIACMMRAVIINLQEKHMVFSQYDALTGRGNGDRAALTGLAPVSLVLQTLGLQLLLPNKIVIEGFNVFPWPVTVQYRGIKIFFLSDSTRVLFPGGQEVIIDDPKRHVITLS